MLVFFQCLTLQIRIDTTRLRIRSQRTTKEKNVWLGSVKSIVDPSPGLLDSDTAPFALAEETVAGKLTKQFLG
jgi:hypothetical protein